MKREILVSGGGIVALAKKYKGLIPYYTYSIHYSDKDQAFIASVKELPGCETHGKTMLGALEMIHEAVEGHLEVMVSEKLQVPEPISRIASKKKCQGRSWLGR